MSKTKTARGTPIWGAASPTPGASYMVSIMSSTSRRTPASMSLTGVAGIRSTGSPNERMGKITWCVVRGAWCVAGIGHRSRGMGEEQ